jgi:hypothetical protein
VIPHTKQHNLQSGGAVGESKEYSFEMNAHMASLLSDKLYSNKVEAIIRELACNAQDSHVEAGNTNPIDVHLPTVIEPFFYIEDFGIGLSHEDVMDLYTTYGASTKRGTNTQVGQFGLGSKVFFAYTDQATITATKDGIRTQYAAFKDESGMPNITTMGAAIHDSSLPNGVKVYVGVLPGDIEAFSDSAQSIFRRFDPRPNILGGSDYKIEEYESIMDGNGWILRREETGYYNRQKAVPFAVQGNVAYRISADEMDSHIGDTPVHFMLSLPFDITFEIGELDVSSSREELSYNKQTIGAIITRFNGIYDELTTTLIPDLFTDCTTQWEATKVLAELMEGSDDEHYRDLIKGAAVFNGVPVEEKIEIGLDMVNPAFIDLTATPDTLRRIRTFKDTTIIYLPEREFSLKTSSFAKDQVKPRTLTLVGEDEYLVLWDDKSKPRQPSRLKLYMESEYGEAKRGYRSNWRTDPTTEGYPRGVYVVQCDTEVQMRKVQVAMGGHPYSKFNDIVPEIPKVVRVKLPGGGTTARDITVTYYSGHRRSSYGGSERDEKRKQWNDTVVDTTVETTGYYVDLHAWSVKEGPDIQRLYNLAANIGLLYTPTQIHGCPGSIKNPFVKLPGWKDLTQELKRLTLEWFDDPLNVKAVILKDVLDLDDLDFPDTNDIRNIRGLLTKVVEYAIIPVGSVAKDYLTYLTQGSDKLDIIKGYHSIQCNLLYSDKIDKLITREKNNKKSIVKTLLKQRTEFYKKYPVLRYVSDSDIDNQDAATEICQYIKQMEKN